MFLTPSPQLAVLIGTLPAWPAALPMPLLPELPPLLLPPSSPSIAVPFVSPGPQPVPADTPRKRIRPEKRASLGITSPILRPVVGLGKRPRLNTTSRPKDGWEARSGSQPVMSFGGVPAPSVRVPRPPQPLARRPPEQGSLVWGTPPPSRPRPAP